MADASLTFLLENLKHLILHHVDLISNAGKELKELEKELGIMNAALEDASRLHNKNKVFEKLEEQIRELVYEVEDTIDACVAAANKKSFLRPGGRSLAEEVRSMRGKVKSLYTGAIKDVLLKLGDADKSLQKLPTDIRKKNPREENVVGFEDETEKLISYLKDEYSEKLEVISIVGMPGLGKTTVAWKIFKDQRIQYEFPTLIWVYVSQTFNKKDVFLTILKSFTQQDLSGKDVDELSKMVKKHLEKGKFVIFMDDVWTTEAWDEIRAALPLNNKSGKVLITSRDECVASNANPNREPHKLRFLTEDESWELLQLEIYGTIQELDRDLARVGKLIAEKCDGLPLAIVVIGGILIDVIASTRESTSFALKKAWEAVSKSVEAHLMNKDKLKRMGNIISLSYTKLPYNVRDCFLYMGMFPEDTEIPASKLIRLWIAEGFIQEQPGKRLEETASDNLKDLINRNLVMVHKTHPDGEVKLCRVHDTIREFCKTEAALRAKNLFQEVKLSNGVFEPKITELEKYRRLCVHSYVHDFFSYKPKVPKTRSFLCFSKAAVVLETKHITSVTEAFCLLRVLDANTIKFPKLAPKIMQLVHLRYLTFSSDELKTLPDSIFKLWNLQTLIVNTLSRTLVVDGDMWKLMKLRHFMTKASIILKKDGKGKQGENLQTLGRLSPKSCTEDVCTKAKNLNTLGIRGNLSELVSEPNICLEKLKLLNKLKLVHEVFPSVASENPLSELPQPNKFPVNLKVLTISGTYLDWSHMSTLGKLSFLEVLKLKNHAFMGSSWDVDGGSFGHLEFLHIERTDLKFWDVTGDAFPRLKGVVLRNCEKLQGVPFILHKTLEMLSLERVTPYAVSSAKKIENAKKEKQGHQITRRGGLKLVVAPGDQTPN